MSRHILLMHSKIQRPEVMLILERAQSELSMPWSVAILTMSMLL